MAADGVRRAKNLDRNYTFEKVRIPIIFFLYFYFHKVNTDDLFRFREILLHGFLPIQYLFSTRPPIVDNLYWPMGDNHVAG